MLSSMTATILNRITIMSTTSKRCPAGVSFPKMMVPTRSRSGERPGAADESEVSDISVALLVSDMSNRGNGKVSRGCLKDYWATRACYHYAAMLCSVRHGPFPLTIGENIKRCRAECNQHTPYARVYSRLGMGTNIHIFHREARFRSKLPL